MLLVMVTRKNCTTAPLKKGGTSKRAGEKLARNNSQLSQVHLHATPARRQNPAAPAAQATAQIQPTWKGSFLGLMQQDLLLQRSHANLKAIFCLGQLSCLNLQKKKKSGATLVPHM